jgi:hypothetical protein
MGSWKKNYIFEKKNLFLVEYVDNDGEIHILGQIVYGNLVLLLNFAEKTILKKNPETGLNLI